MPEEMDLVKLNAILRYAKDVKHMRLANASANTLRVRTNEMLKAILTEATASAKAQKRSTILPRDMEPSMERIIGRKNLEPSEVLREIKRLGAIELGQVSKLLVDYIASEKAKKE